MMTRILAFVLVIAAGAAQAAPLEFKGVPFGATVAQFTTAHPAFDCMADPRLEGGQLCSAGVMVCQRRGGCGPADFDASRYAEERVRMIVAVFPAGTLERLEIYFDSPSYEAIRDTLAGRYGKPAISRSVAQAVGGARSPNETATWSADGGEILINRYGKSLVQGDLTLMSRRYLETSGDQDRAVAQKRGKGI